MGSGFEIGGDGSVQYRCVISNLRAGTVCNERRGPNGWEQGAIDETPAKGDFTVTLKVPENSTRFVKSLLKAAASAAKYANKVGKEIRFTIPVEPDSPGQIQIYWESAPAGKGKSRKAKAGKKR